MTDKEIIQALKNNRYPFGMWAKPECYGTEFGEAMQAKAREINKNQFDYFDGDVWDSVSLMRSGSDNVFVSRTAYRLRPEYEETKPGIVECEVTEARNGLLVFDRPDGITNCCFATAMKYPDFAGVLYKDVFGDEVYMELWLNLDKNQDGNNKATHATHVLFQVTK